MQSLTRPQVQILRERETNKGVERIFRESNQAQSERVFERERDSRELRSEKVLKQVFNQTLGAASGPFLKGDNVTNNRSFTSIVQSLARSPMPAVREREMNNRTERISRELDHRDSRSEKVLNQVFSQVLLPIGNNVDNRRFTSIAQQLTRPAVNLVHDHERETSDKRLERTFREVLRPIPASIIDRNREVKTDSHREIISNTLKEMIKPIHIEGRASGGPIWPDRAYQLHKDEIVMPTAPGHVFNQQQIKNAEGSTVINNYNTFNIPPATGAQSRNEKRSQREIAETIASTLQSRLT